jgi:Domain of unknown function (DUF4190)
MSTPDAPQDSAPTPPFSPPGSATPPVSPTQQPTPGQPPLAAGPYPQAGYPAPASYPQQVGYPQQPYVPGPYVPAPYGYAPPPPTNTLAIVSLVCSALGLTTGITAIAGVICGHLALGQISRSGEQGRGLAIAGIAIGYAVIALFALIILGWVFFALLIATAPSTGASLGLGA